MKNHFCLLLAIYVFVFAGAAIAADRQAATQWDRGHALAAVRSVDLEAAVLDIANVSTLASAETTLEKLRQLETRSDWPLPAREAALFEFTRALAELPRAAVASGVLEHLQDYQAQTLVADEDHPGTLVPLFNIHAAAVGVDNGWQRTAFSAEADNLVRINPAALVTAYLQTGNHNQRSGYLDTLRQADVRDLAVLQQAALAVFEDNPDLTPVVGLTAVMTADTSAVRQLLSFGSGAGLAAALRQLDQRLQPADKETLLAFAVGQAPAANAALAIAAWWPGLRHVASVRDLLVDKLADPELGSAAALALANGPDTLTIGALQRAAQGDTVAARRAQMALAINRELLNGGTRP